MKLIKELAMVVIVIISIPFMLIYMLYSALTHKPGNYDNE